MLSATAMEWAAVALLALGRCMIGNLLWYSLRQRLRVDQVTPFLRVMPVIGIAAGAVVLSEPSPLPDIVGGLLILTGLNIVSGLNQGP